MNSVKPKRMFKILDSRNLPMNVRFCGQIAEYIREGMIPGTKTFHQPAFDNSGEPRCGLVTLDDDHVEELPTYEVRPCTDDDDGQVVPCEPSEASYWGVYEHQPADDLGVQECVWAADFAVESEAIAYAKRLEDSHGLRI